MTTCFSYARVSNQLTGLMKGVFGVPRGWGRILGSLTIAASCGLAGCTTDPTGVEPVCGEEPMLEPGVDVTGLLDPDDPRFEDAPIDYYSVMIEDSTLVVLRLSSTDFDPFLYLFGSGSSVAAQSFDPHGEPPGTNESAILARNLAPGCHLVGATAWDPTGAGTYTIRLQIAQPLVAGLTEPPTGP